MKALYRNIDRDFITQYDSCFYANSMFYLSVFVSLFLLVYGGADALQWPPVYHVKATLKIPSANLVEPYEIWSNGVNGHHRYDFYNGMTKMYQKRRGMIDNKPHFLYYWVRPDAINVNHNKTICYQLQNTSIEMKLPFYFIPPTYNFSSKGQDVNGTTKWEFRYTGRTYGAVYVYTLWTIGTTDEWVPVKYEYRMLYAGVERDFIQHTYEYFSRAKPDATVYQIPKELRCKSYSAQHTDKEYEHYSDPVSLPVHDMTEVFERFKVTHKKQYKTNEEHFRRFTVFLQNYRYIQNVNRQQGSYKLAVNQFTDLTEDELTNLKNGTKFEPELNDFTESFLDNDEEDDEDFDWRWYDALSPVKDQTFLCGSCYAFATAAAVESAVYISKGCQDMVEVSEQAIIDCSRGPNGTGNQGCNGGLLSSSMAWVKKYGIPLRKDYGPYLAMDGYCKLVKSQRQYIHGYRKLPREIKAIKEGLRQYGPLAAVMHVPGSLFFHSSGIYDDNTCLSTPGTQSHAVVIAGYGKENGKRYWLVRNSWGSQWSEQGYFKLDMENNLCGITNLVYAVVANANSLAENCRKRHGRPLRRLIDKQ